MARPSKVGILVLACLLSSASLLGQLKFEDGVRLYEAEQYEAARPYFKSYLASHPGHLQSIEYLGDIAGYGADWDTAIDYFEQLVEADDQNANYHFKLGGSLGMKALEISKFRALSYVGDIKKHFEAAARLDPQHIETRWALVEYYIQLPGIIGGSQRKARKYADELLDISPVDGHLAHGYIAEYNDRFEDAEDHYKKAISVGGSVHTYDKLTNLYLNNDKPEEALDTTKECLDVHDRNSLHYQVGKIVAQYDLDAELGINCLKKYIEGHSVRDGVPLDWAYFRMAQIFRNQGDKANAKIWINKALESRPDFEEALEEKALIDAL